MKRNELVGCLEKTADSTASADDRLSVYDQVKKDHPDWTLIGGNDYDLINKNRQVQGTVFGRTVGPATMKWVIDNHPEWLEKERLPKEAGAIRDLVTIGLPVAAGAAIGKNISKDISFDDKVEVQMKANPGMKRNTAIEEVYRRDEMQTPDAKAKKMKQFATTAGGGLVGLLAALKARRIIR